MGLRTLTVVLSAIAVAQLIYPVDGTVEQCNGAINLAVAMDSSNSLTFLEFLTVKLFTRDLVSRINMGSIRTKFFAVSYSVNVTDVIAGTGSNDMSDILDKLEMLNRGPDGTGTRTDLAIERITNLLTENSASDPSRPNVGIIVTDGMSTSGEKPLKLAARRALEKGIILIAVGVGRSFASGDLLAITNYRPELVVQSEFDELRTVALNKTLKRVCEFSYYDQGVLSADNCTGTGDVAIAVQIENTPGIFDFRSLSSLVQRLEDNTTIALLDVNKVHSIDNKANTMNYLSVDNSHNYGYHNNLDSTANLIQKAMGVFSYERSVPKVIVLMIDAIHATETSLKDAIKAAKDMKMEVMVLLYGYSPSALSNAVKILVDASVKWENILTHSTKVLDSLVSSAYNQVLYRICSVLHAGIMPDIREYGGLFDLALSLDMCNKEPKNLDQSINYLEFVRILAENLVYNQWNMSLSVSISRCHPSFNTDVTRLQNYVHHAFYHHKSLSNGDRITIGDRTDMTASELLGKVITTLQGPFYSTGIIFVTKADDRLTLMPLIETAKQKGIRLIAIGVKGVHAIVDERQLLQTVQFLDISQLNLGVLSLSDLANMREENLLKIRDQIRLPGEVMFGMSNAGNLDPNALKSIDVFMSKLQDLVAKTEHSDVFRANITRDINTFISNERVRIEAGLPNIQGAIRYIRIYRDKGLFNHGVIITNQAPKNCPDTRTEAALAKNNNIKLHAIGWGKNITEGLLCITNDDRDYVTYTPGSLTTKDLDATVNSIESNSNVAIMVDSSRYTSEQDFNTAINFAGQLIKRLGSEKQNVRASVVLFSDDNKEIMPLQQIDGTTSIPKTLHLRNLYPAANVLKTMMTVTPPSPENKRYVFLLLDSDMLYESMAKLYSFASKPIFTMVPIDMTENGDVKNFKDTFMAVFSQFVGEIRYSKLSSAEFSSEILGIITNTKQNSKSAFVEFGIKRQPPGADLSRYEAAIEAIIRGMYSNFDEVNFEIRFADWDQFYDIRYLYKDNFNVDIAVANVIRDFRLLHGVDASKNAIALALMEVKDTPWSHKKKVAAVVTSNTVSDKSAVEELVAQAKVDGIYTMAVGVGPLATENLRSFVTNDSTLFITNPAERLPYEGASKVIDILSSLTRPSVLEKLCDGGKADIVIGIVLDEKDNPFQLQTSMKTITNQLEYESPNVRRNILITYSSRDSNQAGLNKTLEEKVFGDTMMYVAKELCNKLQAYDVNNGREKIAIMIIDSKSFKMPKDYDLVLQLHQGPIKYIVVGIGDFTAEAVDELRLLTNYIDENLVFIRNSQDLDFSNKNNELLKSICDASHGAKRINITKICFDYMDPNIIANYFPNPYDCNAFIQCSMSVDGKKIEADLERCPAQLRWNVQQQKCLPVGQVDCFINRSFLQRTPPRKVKPSIPIVQALIDSASILKICDEICPPQMNPAVKASAVTAYPNDCFKYIVCEKASKHDMSYIIKTCDEGLFFNPSTKKCGKPDDVQCAADPCKNVGKGEKRQKHLSCYEYQYCENGKTRTASCSGNDRLFAVKGELFCMDDDGTIPCRGEKVVQTCEPLFIENFEKYIGSMNGVIYENQAASFYGMGFLYMSGLDQVLSAYQFLLRIDLSIRNTVHQYATIFQYCNTNLRLEGAELLLKANFTGGRPTLKVPFEYTGNSNVDRVQMIVVAYRNGLLVLQYEYNTGSKHVVTEQVSGHIPGCSQPVTFGDPSGGVNNWNTRETGFRGQIHHIEGFTCIPEEFFKSLE